MKHRSRLAALGAVALMLLSPTLTPVANAHSEFRSQAQAPTVTRTVSITRSPRNVNEGDRFKVTVRVGVPSQARSVAIQNLQTNIFGDTEWVSLGSKRVKGRARHTFSVVANGENTQRYRAVANYRSAPKRVVSKRIALNVWRWIDLHLFRPYYSTPGIAVHEYAYFGMNGDRWLGWYTNTNHGMWETRHTPGRKCKAFRGVFGVTDSSPDGSSAQFTLVADETKQVFQSTTLVPGAVQSVKLAIAKPYRLAIQARSTSPESVPVYPAIGNPQFLCTGF